LAQAHAVPAPPTLSHMQQPPHAAPTRGFTTLNTVIEELGFTTYHWYVLFTASAVWAICGWSATLVVYLLDAAGERQSDWVHLTAPSERLTVSDKALMLAASNAVAGLSNIAIGSCADSVGRIMTCTICAALTVFSVAGFAFADSKLMLFALLMASPFIKDGPCTPSGCLLAEWLPIKFRGVLLVTLHLAWNLGRAAVTLLWVAMPPTEVWKPFFVTASICPAVLLLFLASKGSRYESPRWLATTGQMKRSIEQLERARVSDQAAAEASLPENWNDPDCLRIAGTPAGSDDQEQTWQQRMSEVFEADVRGLVLLLGMLHFLLGYYSMGFFYWLLEYLRDIGMSEAAGPAMLAAPLGKMTGVMLLVTGGPGICLIDRFPRVPLLQVGFFGAACCVGGLTLCTKPLLAVAAVYISNIFEEIVWCTASVYVAEVFPTTIRGTAQGLIFFMCSLGCISSSVFTGKLLVLNPKLPMLGMMVVSILGGLLGCFCREERGKEPLCDCTPKHPKQVKYGTMDTEGHTGSS